MEQKKSKKLIIAIIVLLIIIVFLAGTIAYLYFFTDMFKSNKQLFLNYTAQFIQNKNGFIDNQLIQYQQKKKNTSYEHNGEITFNISVPNLEKQLELTNNMNIGFIGKEDPNASKSEKEINIHYSDDVQFPIIYRKTNTITGLQTQYVGSSFVAIRNDENISGYEELNKLANLQPIQFSNEELQNIKTNYIDNILSNLEDGKFSQLTEGELTGYKLTLTGEELKNILIQMLNTLKTDKMILGKINDIQKNISDTTELGTDEIQTLIEDIEENWKLKDNIEFTVYEKDKMLTKLVVATNGNTITINKEKNEQEISYTMDFSEALGKIELNMKYTGLQSDNIMENYQITLEEKQSEQIRYQYTITNYVQFKDSVEIEDLTEENAVILNDKEDTYVTNLLTAIQGRLTQVNKVQMEKLGVSENENPLQYVLPTFLFRGNVGTEINETEINTFNAKFELYQSTNTKGATVKGLLTTIQNNNEIEENHKIEEINMDGEEYEVTEQNITFLKSNINVNDAYKVEFEKDSSTGLIYRAVINKR